MENKRNFEKPPPALKSNSTDKTEKTMLQIYTVIQTTYNIN